MNQKEQQQHIYYVSTSKTAMDMTRGQSIILLNRFWVKSRMQIKGLIMKWSLEFSGNSNTWFGIIRNSHYGASPI